MTTRARPTTLRLDDLYELAVSEAAECRAAVSLLIIKPTQTAAFPIPQGPTGRPRNLKNRCRINVKNSATEDQPTSPTLYLGGPDVTTANGYLLPPQEYITLDMTDRIQLYVVRQSGPGIPGDGAVRTLELA